MTYPFLAYCTFFYYVFIAIKTDSIFTTLPWTLEEMLYHLNFNMLSLLYLIISYQFFDFFPQEVGHADS